jgi:hypothetical protein
MSRARLAQPAPPLPYKARRLLLWTAAAAVAAVCLCVLLLWGLYGSTFILDLIAAYCGF